MDGLVFQQGKQQNWTQQGGNGGDAFSFPILWQPQHIGDSENQPVARQNPHTRKKLICPDEKRMERNDPRSAGQKLGCLELRTSVTPRVRDDLPSRSAYRIPGRVLPRAPYLRTSLEVVPSEARDVLKTFPFLSKWPSSTSVSASEMQQRASQG
jgi:hypothetical protein